MVIHFLRGVYARFLYRYLTLTSMLLLILIIGSVAETIVLDSVRALISIGLGTALALWVRPLASQLYEEAENLYWSGSPSDHPTHWHIVAFILYLANYALVLIGPLYFGLSALSFSMVSLLIVVIIERTRNRRLYDQHSLNAERKVSA
jgi:hypothetical protein